MDYFHQKVTLQAPYSAHARVQKTTKPSENWVLAHDSELAEYRMNSVSQSANSQIAYNQGKTGEESSQEGERRTWYICASDFTKWLFFLDVKKDKPYICIKNQPQIS